MDPKFRYFLYAWTSNASLGLGAQVVLAGNLELQLQQLCHHYRRNHVVARYAERRGQLSVLAGVDSRLIADEFFRPSYTSGVRA